MDYQEAIKYFEFKIDKYKRIASQRNRFDQSIDNSGLEEEIEFLKIAISTMRELQLYKDGKLCLIPESVYSKQCTELDAYKQLGTPEEVREALEKAEKYHWHDLRKNPDDIPSGRNMCTCFVEGDFVIEDGSVAHGKYPVIIPFPFSEYEYRYNFKVVAWREIEPFEREVEE